MRARVSGWYNIAPAIAVSVLAAGLLVGCGGGGSGGGNSGNLPPTMPQVFILLPQSSQPTTINLGRAVTLNWGSVNTTSCSVTSSSTIGGSFTANQGTSGSMTIAPTGTGNVTYTITCTGSKGSANATTGTITVNPSILSTLQLTKIAVIGPTADPIVKEPIPNPYGLTIAPVTAGLMTKGDLIVCNFNDPAGNQGEGTTIVGLHPAPGSTPYRIAQSASLAGCNALATLADGSISAAAWGTNQNPLIAPDGTVNTPFSTDQFAKPWGEAYVAATGQNSAALYISNFDGSIDRITLNGDAQSAFTQIATGFCGSGPAGSIYAPSGLTYDASIDTLYVVDTSSYSVVAFADVSSIGAGGIVVAGQCQSGMPPTPVPTFSGPSAPLARVIAHGGGFVAPISAALLADGDLIVANSDVNLPPGQMINQAFEISPVFPGGFVGPSIQLDTDDGPGVLFGIATAVDAQGHQIVYFNEDNDGVVKMVTQ